MTLAEGDASAEGFGKILSPALDGLLATCATRSQATEAILPLLLQGPLSLSLEVSYGRREGRRSSTNPTQNGHFGGYGIRIHVQRKVVVVVINSIVIFSNGGKISRLRHCVFVLLRGCGTGESFRLMRRIIFRVGVLGGEGGYLPWLS